MDERKSKKPEEATQQADRKIIERDIKEYRPFKRLLLLDVLQDRESRPLLLWVSFVLLVGVIVYHWLEGWSVLDSLYFCVITLATIGYGDLTPTTPLAKAFTIFYVINGIGILVGFFDRIRVVRARELTRPVTDGDSKDNHPKEN